MRLCLSFILLCFSVFSAPASATPQNLDDIIAELKKNGLMTNPAAVMDDRLPLYAHVEKDAQGYHFSEFSFEPVRENGWLNVITSGLMWDRSSKPCSRHVVGGSCDAYKSQPFGRLDTSYAFNSLMTVGTLGLVPLFQGLHAEYVFDYKEWNMALEQAVARYENEHASALKADVARLSADWEALIAIERRSREGMINPRLDFQLTGPNAGLLEPAKRGLVTASIEYPWHVRMKGRKESLTDLMKITDEAIAEYATADYRAWPLLVACPSSRLVVYVAVDKCDVQGGWSDGVLILSGNVVIKGVAFPFMFPAVYEAGQDGFQVKYKDGVVEVKNDSSRKVTLHAITLWVNGKALRQLLKNKAIHPGASAYYTGYAGWLAGRERPGPNNLLDAKRLGLNTEYGIMVYAYDEVAETSINVEKKEQSTVEQLLQKVLVAEAMQADATNYNAVARAARSDFHMR
ncbi:MAG: hypothetical protein ACRERR_08565 [Moraxellaceae bacterium]